MKEPDSPPDLVPPGLDQLLAHTTMEVPARPPLRLPRRARPPAWGRWWIAASLGVVTFAAPRVGVVPPLAALIVWTDARPVLLTIAVALWSGVLGVAGVYLGTVLGSGPSPSPPAR